MKRKRPKVIDAADEVAFQIRDSFGAYEFDPLFASQDLQVKNFKIAEVQWGGTRKDTDGPSRDGVARVAVTFKDNGEARELRFEFEQRPDKTWRISEIHYPDGTSLLQILRKAYPG
jgi:hypothetical protein